MGKLIQFPDPDWQVIEQSLKILDNLPDEAVIPLIGLIAYLFLEDMRIGLSGGEQHPFFKKVDELYKQIHGECYFCNRDIDPNETEFTQDTHLCLFCLLKVANILTAAGVDPKKLSEKIGKREVQKARL